MQICGMQMIADLRGSESYRTEVFNPRKYKPSCSSVANSRSSSTALRGRETVVSIKQETQVLEKVRFVV